MAEPQGIGLSIEATIRNDGPAPAYVESCGGSPSGTVELWRGSTLVDTWGAFCLTDRDQTPIQIAPGSTATLARWARRETGASYRVLVRYLTEPAASNWRTLTARPVTYAGPRAPETSDQDWPYSPQ